jgi:hypothetical protein
VKRYPARSASETAVRQEHPDNAVRRFPGRILLVAPGHLGPLPAGPVRFHPSLRTAGELATANPGGGHSDDTNGHAA